MDICIKSFNELTKEELYEIVKIRSEVFVVEQNCPYQDCDGKDIDAKHFFLKIEDKIVAYLRILDKGVSYEEVSIGRVLVHIDYRKNSIATYLMINAINYIEEFMNETKIRISAQLYLLKFYKKLGFKEVSEEYLEDDIPHIEMLYTTE